MNKKKIYINGRFLTQTITGVQRYAIEVVKSFDQMLSNGNIDLSDYEFVLLVPNYSKYKIPLANIKIVKVGKLTGQLWEQLELPFFSSGHLLLNLCNTAPIFKSKQLVTIHDAAASANQSNYSFAFRTWYQFLHHILPYRSKRIITDSSFSKNELMKYYLIKEEKIKVIYLGIEHINVIKAAPNILHSLNSNYILAVSSVNPNKNFKGIIEAFKYIENEEVQIVIVGDQDNPIYNETNFHSSSQIEFVGYVTDKELKALYLHAKCFVFPSFYEGFGLPPLEAMSCGCPVIASNRSSLPEILGDSVLYCDPDNPKDIAEKIKMMIDYPEISADFQRKGLEKARQYSWNRCGFELFEIVKEVMDL